MSCASLTRSSQARLSSQHKTKPAGSLILAGFFHSHPCMQGEMANKKCNGCGVVKPEDEFPWSNSHGKKIRRATCVSCWKERRSKYNVANREKRRAYNREYHRVHRAELLRKMAEYRRTEKFRESQRKSSQRIARKKYLREFNARRTLERYHNDAEFRQKHVARTYVHNAVSAGTLIRPDSCSRCGKECTPEGHHHKGYDREYWLDVIWLCARCHRQEHREHAEKQCG